MVFSLVLAINHHFKYLHVMLPRSISLKDNDESLIAPYSLFKLIGNNSCYKLMIRKYLNFEVV